jgi:Uma2 family endonuclease
LEASLPLRTSATCCQISRSRSCRRAIAPGQLLDKIGEYLQAGVRLVWVIDPGRERAAIHRSLTDVREVGPSGALDGEDVLPGFSCLLRDVLSQQV